MTLYSIASKSIPNGTKFVAIHDDGSGADLFFIDDLGDLYDTNLKHLDAAPDTWLMNAKYAYWMLLPDSFKLWFEQCEEKRP
jgi:hypothetical protein